MSKFDQILDAAKGRDKSTAKKSAKAERQPNAPAKRRGRPATGKRSDPEFDQTTAYIRKDTYKAVKIALIQAGEDMDYSDLVEDLLSAWLKTRK